MLPSLKASANTDSKLTPGSRDYDVMRLISLIGLQNTFAAEPRDSSWAPSVEQALSPLMRKDLRKLVPSAELEIECRTAVCRVRWDVPKEAEQKAHEILLRLYAGSTMDDRNGNEILVAYAGGEFFAKETGNAELLIARLTHDREARLRQVSSGKAPPSAYRVLHRGEWPDP